jgi:hypothetical protein
MSLETREVVDAKHTSDESSGWASGGTNKTTVFHSVGAMPLQTCRWPMLGGGLLVGKMEAFGPPETRTICGTAAAGAVFVVPQTA